MFKKKVAFLFFLTIFTILTTCKKVEKVMMVLTGTASDTTYTSAKISGEIIDLGEGATQHGHYYGKTHGITTSDSKTQLGLPTGSNDFASQLTNLESGTKYYFKSYLSNGNVTIFGMELSFSTIPLTVPSITTTSITSITTMSAISGGNISRDGGSSVSARGICFSTSQNPTISDNSTSDGSGTGSFVSNLTGLTSNKTYYVRAYSTNNIGIAYGNEQSFTTIPNPPIAATDAATSITVSSATLNGSVNAKNSSTTVTFEYGLTLSYGSSITATQSPVIGNSIISVSANLTDLSPNSTYHYRVKAVNADGITYGSDILFTTLEIPPSATTIAVTSVTSTTAKFYGIVNANNSSTIVTFEYGQTSSFGSSVPAIPSPVTGSIAISVNVSLTNLTANTTYHFRIKAVNSAGTTYGDDLTFKTFTGIVTDLDNNIYNTTTIGTQIWMAENLKTVHFNDGTVIPNVTDKTAWATLITPAYCWYNNDSATYITTYGALYNWYTVNTNILCPTGWHVPTYSEWTVLSTYLGGASVAGGKLKEIGTLHWSTPNTGATNETYFTALPGGSRCCDGSFSTISQIGGWWCSNEISTSSGWDFCIFWDKSNVFFTNPNKFYGLSVRCIKN